MSQKNEKQEFTLEYLYHKYWSVNNIACLLVVPWNKLPESLIKKMLEAALILCMQTNVIKTDG